MTDIAEQEPLPSEDTTPEDQHDHHQFDDAPNCESDPILDYINSQHHKEEDMNNALQAYNVMTSPTSGVTPQRTFNSAHIHLFYHVAQAKQAQHGSLFDMVIWVLMVALQALVLESSKHLQENALSLVLTSTRSMVWTLCNVLHWSKPTMGMSTSS